MNTFFVHELDCYINLNLYKYKIQPRKYMSYIFIREVIFSGVYELYSKPIACAEVNLNIQINKS